MSWCFWLLSIAALCVALFLSFFEFIPTPTDENHPIYDSPIPSSKRPYHYRTDQTTPMHKTSWNGSTTIVDAILDQHPISFRAPFVSEWEALNWDLWALSGKWPVLFDTLSSHQSLFHLHEDGEGLFGQDDISRPDILPSQGMKTFLTESLNPNIYMYYSTNYVVMESLAQLHSATTWKDFLIWESFVDIFQRLNMSEDRMQLRQPPPTLSILHPGVALQTRYHVEHIVRTQLTGRTRYVLFPPTKHSSLFLFPSIHSCHQLSQINIEEDLLSLSDSDIYLSKFLKVPHISVELTSGESLYIPPYWLVRVENIELSLYLDVKSLSKEQVLLSEAQSLGVVLGNVTTPDERIIAAQVYAVHFLSRIEGLQSPEKFAESHYHTRYSRLFPRDSLYMTKLLKSFNCLSNQPFLYQSIIEKLDREGIKRSAQYAADRLNDPALSIGVKWIWVGDYIDLIARWAMRDPKEAVAFVTTCLRFESKIQVVEEVRGPDVMKIGPDSR